MGSHPRLHKLFSSNSSWILMVQISQISLSRSKLRIFCRSQKTLHGNLMIGGVTRMLIPGPLRPREIHGNSIHPKMVKFPWRGKQGMWEIELDPHEWWTLKSSKIYCSFLAHFQPESQDSYCWDRMISILGFPWYLVNGAGCKSRK